MQQLLLFFPNTKEKAILITVTKLLLIQHYHYTQKHRKPHYPLSWFLSQSSKKTAQYNRHFLLSSGHVIYTVSTHFMLHIAFIKALYLMLNVTHDVKDMLACEGYTSLLKS